MGKMIDLTGKKFGRLTVIERNGSTKDKRTLWLCECDCGNFKLAVGKELRNGRCQSCGCLFLETVSKKEDLTGRKFGRLTVIQYAGKRNEKSMWKCECECTRGKYKIVAGGDLKSGRTQSCGCLQKELFGKKHRTHGMTESRIYGIWCNMKGRCHNKNITQYSDYGGRGIKVCDEWLHDFQEFYDWAIKNGYSDNLTIERKDINGDYEPQNCEWITKQEQQWNKRNTHYIYYNGKKMNMKQAVEFLGVSRPTIIKYEKLNNGNTQKAVDEILERIRDGKIKRKGI